MTSTRHPMSPMTRKQAIGAAQLIPVLRRCVQPLQGRERYHSTNFGKAQRRGVRRDQDAAYSRDRNPSRGRPAGEAIAILKAKERPSDDDAKRVEDTFAARMVPQKLLPDNMATTEATSALSDTAKPQATAASNGARSATAAKGPSQESQSRN